MLLNNVHWSKPVTENPVLDSVEIWNLINTTDDAHPIHLHLVEFQILDRRSFSVADLLGEERDQIHCSGDASGAGRGGVEGYPCAPILEW